MHSPSSKKKPPEHVDEIVNDTTVVPSAELSKIASHIPVHIEPSLMDSNIYVAATLIDTDQYEDPWMFKNVPAQVPTTKMIPTTKMDEFLTVLPKTWSPPTVEELLAASELLIVVTSWCTSEPFIL